MKKMRIVFAAAAAAVALLMTACGDSAESKYDFTMPDQPTEFVTKVVNDPNEDSLSYAAVEYDGKTYVTYGTLEGELEQSDLGNCLGYMVQDGQKLEDVRIFTLAADPDQNYLLCMDKQGMMEKRFFRNSETLGQDITTPSFIKTKDYSYWE